MRKTILFVFLFISSVSLYSQQDSVLKNFKYRIDHYRAITLNVNGGSSYNKSELGSGDTKNSSSSGSFSVGMNTIRSTDNILRTTYGNISSSFNSNRSENTSTTNKNKGYFAAVQYSLLNKQFSGQRFIEYGIDAAGSINSDRQTSSMPQPALKNKQSSYAVALPVGIGKGRLENITDMQNALWLQQSLQEAGRLSNTLSAEELNQLGRSITRGNNTRILDFRKRTQFILETVDSYLQQKGLISKNDITYFSNLNDILFFAFNNNRLAGTEKFIRLTPSLSGYNRNGTQIGVFDKYEMDPYIVSGLVSIGFNKYKPVNLKHQDNYGVAVKLNYISWNSTERYFSSGVLFTENKFDQDIKQAGLKLFYQHAFYPNTRTNINLNLETEGGYQDAGATDEFYGMASLAGNLNYFISYRTRLTFDIGAAYRKNIYTAYQTLQVQPDNIQFFINAGIGINL